MKLLKNLTQLPRCIFPLRKGYSTDLPNLLSIPRVQISNGQMRYLLLMIYSHGFSGFGRTIIRGADVDHLDIFDQALEEMEPQKICVKCLGGGMINNNVGDKKIRVYGYCRVFGDADHYRTKNILQSWTKYRDFKITAKN